MWRKHLVNLYVLQELGILLESVWRRRISGS